MGVTITDPALAIAFKPAVIIVGLILAAQAIFHALKWKTQSERIMNLWKRLMVVVPLITIIFAAIEFGPMAWAPVVGFFVLASHREYFIATEHPDRAMYGVGAVVLLGLVLAATFEGEHLSGGPAGSVWLGAALAAGMMVTWFVPIAQDRADGVVQDLGRAMIGFFLAWCFMHGAFLMHLGPNGSGAVLFTFFITAVSDAGGLVFGMAFGKHPMRPTLSPKKTWQGFAGGLLCALAAAWYGRGMMVGLSDVEVLCLALLLGIVGVMGDLALSSIKRDLGIKDFSNALPGHGGFLDRVDSFLLAAPVCYWILLILG